jgi:hypothetical protein
MKIVTSNNQTTASMTKEEWLAIGRKGNFFSTKVAQQASPITEDEFVSAVYMASAYGSSNRTGLTIEVELVREQDMAVAIESLSYDPVITLSLEPGSNWAKEISSPEAQKMIGREIDGWMLANVHDGGIDLGDTDIDVKFRVDGVDNDTMTISVMDVDLSSDRRKALMDYYNKEAADYGRQLSAGI